jgi:hypothetical protein
VLFLTFERNPSLIHFSEAVPISTLTVVVVAVVAVVLLLVLSSSLSPFLPVFSSVDQPPLYSFQFSQSVSV